MSRLFGALFILICFSGFMFQVQTISLVYFAFATATDILISLPENITVPDFSFCARYSDVFDLQSFQPGSLNDPSRKPTSVNDEDIRALQNKVTIEQIFKHTPDIRELWIRCLSRKVRNYNVYNTNATACNRIFKIRKFYVQEYICYNFHQTVSENQDYLFRNIAFSLAFPGVFFGIILENNGTLGKAEYCRAVVHSAVGLPLDSLSLSPGFYRKYDEEEHKAKYNNFQVSYYQLFKKLLPPPFKTNCRSYHIEGLSNQNNCINRCMNVSAVKAFGKIPFSIFQADPIPLKHINTGDLENETFAKQLKGIEDECFGQCDQNDCDDSYTLSQILKEEKANGGEGLSFMVNAPRQPSYTVIHRPLMPITDYLVYVLSCFGTWFGLSVLSLNPFPWSVQVKGPSGHAGKFCCLDTKAELRHEMRRHFTHLSRFVAQMKWGYRSEFNQTGLYKPSLKSRFRDYSNNYPSGELNLKFH